MLALQDYQKYALLLHIIDVSNKESLPMCNQRLHKTVYFLQVDKNISFNYYFSLYKYGIYSFTLKNDINILKAYGYIDYIFKNKTIAAHTCSKNSRFVKERHKNIINKYSSSIEQIINCTKNLNIEFLEKYSAYHYVKCNFYDLNEDSLYDKLFSLQSWLNLDKIRDVVSQRI